MQQDRRVVCAECAEGCVVWRDGDAAVDGQTPALRVIAQEIEEQLDRAAIGVDGIGGLERCPLEIRVARGSERAFYYVYIENRTNVLTGLRLIASRIDQRELLQEPGHTFNRADHNRIEASAVLTSSQADLLDQRRCDRRRADQWDDGGGGQSKYLRLRGWNVIGE